MRRLLFGLLLLASPALAQEQRTYAHNYDLAATAYIYCSTAEGVGPNGERIKTVGSSTTVTAVAGSPFTELEVGDDLLVVNPLTQVETRRRITAKASNTSITVDTAVDWSNSGNGFSFQWKDITCGTTTTDGWVPTAGIANKSVEVLMTTLTGTGGVDISIECRYTGEASAPVQLATANYTGTTSPTNGEVWPVPENCSALRVGLKWGSADGAGPDSVSAYFRGDKSGFLP